MFAFRWRLARLVVVADVDAAMEAADIVVDADVADAVDVVADVDAAMDTDVADVDVVADAVDVVVVKKLLL